MGEWLWGVNDPLLEFIQPDQAVVRLQKNDTLHGPSLYDTGKRNPQRVAFFLEWHNQTEVDVWAEPVPVYGTNADGQFQPFMQEGELVSSWSGTTMRAMNFTAPTHHLWFGIDTMRFELDQSMWAPNPVYYQGLYGFFNATSYQQGVPIFLRHASLCCCASWSLSHCRSVCRA